MRSLIVIIFYTMKTFKYVVPYKSILHVYLYALHGLLASGKWETSRKHMLPICVSIHAFEIMGSFVLKNGS